jgi:hypothetical protein
VYSIKRRREKEDNMSIESEVTVRALLDAANLTVSVPEFERFVRLYPALRAQADALYLTDMESEAPALTFNPVIALD